MAAEHGSIFVESLVSTAILGTVALALLAMYWLAPANQKLATQELEALAIARGRLEMLHQLTPREWDLLDSDPSPVIESSHPEFSVQVVVKPSSVSERFKEVHVTVTWSDNTGRGGSLTLSGAVARREA